MYVAKKTPNQEVQQPLTQLIAAMGRWTAARTFWKAMVFCAILNLAAFNDGFQQQVPGNIIPMPGEQVHTDGTVSLHANRRDQ